jgi:hypothetical protein
MNAPHSHNSRTSWPPTSQQRQSISALRKLWQEAVADDSEGLGLDAVFDRLESKFNDLAKATEQ